MRNLECPFCSHVSSRLFNLKRHIKNRHGREYSKQETSPSIDLKSYLVIGYPTEDIQDRCSIKVYTCKECGKEFNKKFNFKRHCLKVHIAEPKKKSLAVMRVPGTSKSFQCSECNEKYSTSFNLKRHFRRFHPSSTAVICEDERAWIHCQLCSEFKCFHVYNLSRHVRDVHNIQMSFVRHSIRGRENFNKLIESLQSQFSGTLSEDKNIQENCETLSFRCDFVKYIKNLSSRKEVEAPCTFYLDAKKRIVSSTDRGSPANTSEADFFYSISGCISHCGHEVKYPKGSLIDRCSVDMETSSNDPLLNQAEIIIKDEGTADKSIEMISGDSPLCKGGGVGGNVRMSSTVSRINEAYLNRLKDLEAIGPNEYRANFLRGPTGRAGNAFGGLLFAQSLQAAQMTVDSGRFIPHAMHSFFIINVDSTKTASYKVENVRDGRSFATRFVNAQQNGKTVMSSQVSFCAKEETSIEHQIEMPKIPHPDELVNVEEFCKEQLDLYERGEIELSPNTVYYLRNTVESAQENIFEIRSTDPVRYYGLTKSNSLESYCFWVKANCKLGDDPEVHRFLIAYLTDMTLASAANRPHSSRGYVSSMVLSLDHTVHFHAFDYRADEWLLYENCSTWARHSRAYSEGRLWSLDGQLVASTTQESLNRTRGPPSSL